MRLFRDLERQSEFARGSAVTIGNFDGLHRGHQRLIARVREVARERGLASVLVSFEPTSGEYFSTGPGPARIYSVSERLRLLARMELDAVWLIRFNAVLAAMAPNEFVARLQAGLDPRFVIVGADFSYGHRRQGRVADLTRAGEEFGFEVECAGAVCDSEGRISSTRLRELLKRADFEAAARLLGRPYSMYGRVVRGTQLGRKLGFPTANIRIGRRHSPTSGIFAVRVDGPGLIDWPAVASLGWRPTVTRDGEMMLEAHLFDFDGDLYGRHLEITFVKKLREEEKFDSLEDLTAQMHVDARQARRQLAPAIA